MSKIMTKIIDFGTHFEATLIYPVSLAPTCTPFFACVCFASPFLQILCQNWDPVGDPKITLGPPGGHLSSQGRLLEGTFYGPTFYMKFGSQN